MDPIFRYPVYHPPLQIENALSILNLNNYQRKKKKKLLNNKYQLSSVSKFSMHLITYNTNPIRKYFLQQLTLLSIHILMKDTKSLVNYSMHVDRIILFVNNASSSKLTLCIILAMIHNLSSLKNQPKSILLDCQLSVSLHYR